ncbi:MAG: hypothetical protein AMJ81_05085 [Phycisphaerae bacterium SM23_33]|nr:MAG: hypothetical protein AMJ81_05085 [Phycisphaerae bacterium SM23_33]
MGDLLLSSRRITACHRGEPADRIPICSPISWHPMRDIDREQPGGWRSEQGFVRVARLVQEHCDPPPPYCPVRLPRVFSGISYQRFLEAPDEHIEELPPQRVAPHRTRHTTVLHTPKGDLFWSYDQDEGIETRWDIRRPIQCPEDVEKMLSVPYRFVPPDPAEFEPFRSHRRQMAADCIAGAGVNSMVAMLCGMMPFQLLLEWVLTEPGLLKALADAWLERTAAKVDFLLEQGVGPFWHFNGVERASPPMMGPRQWDELVVPYDGEVMRRIKARDGQAVIHVHCHGKVGTLLGSFLEMGVDSTDPVEPPPQGDIGFAEAKRRVHGQMTLYGNIEFLDMEQCTPEQIEEKVRRAIEDGGKAHTVLYPSATPHERHSERFLANAVRYIEAGLRYGSM